MIGNKSWTWNEEKDLTSGHLPGQFPLRGLNWLHFPSAGRKARTGCKWLKNSTEVPSSAAMRSKASKDASPSLPAGPAEMGLDGEEGAPCLLPAPRLCGISAYSATNRRAGRMPLQCKLQEVGHPFSSLSTHFQPSHLTGETFNCILKGYHIIVTLGNSGWTELHFPFWC